LNENNSFLVGLGVDPADPHKHQTFFTIKPLKLSPAQLIPISEQSLPIALSAACSSRHRCRIKRDRDHSKAAFWAPKSRIEDNNSSTCIPFRTCNWVALCTHCHPDAMNPIDQTNANQSMGEPLLAMVAGAIAPTDFTYVHGGRLTNTLKLVRRLRATSTSLKCHFHLSFCRRVRRSRE